MWPNFYCKLSHLLFDLGAVLWKGAADYLWVCWWRAQGRPYCHHECKWQCTNLCTVDSGQWTVYNGQCTMDSGQCTVDSVQWTVDSVQWTVYNGQWTVYNGQWTVYSGQWTVNSGQWTVWHFDTIAHLSAISLLQLLSTPLAVLLPVCWWLAGRQGITPSEWRCN